MTETYTKLSSNIVFSTLWGLDGDTCKVWVTMMALADADGYVGNTVPGLARVANLPVEKVVEALDVFVSPDEYSRTPDNDGRRIEVVEGGWVLLNHGLYRGKRDLEDRRAADRERKRRQRERDRHAVSGEVTVESAPSRDVTPSPPPSAQAEAEAETPPKPPRRGRRARPPKFTDDEVAIASAVIERINELVREIKPKAVGFDVESPENLRHIVKRIRAGVDLETLLAVADARGTEARGDPVSFSYFNPQTPFRDKNWPMSLSKLNAAGRAPPGNTQQAGDWKPTEGAM